MADLSTITLPSGTTYNIKDATARTDISSLVDRVIDLEDLVQDLSKYTEYLGVTTANLTDGDTTNPISINGVLVTATSGDIVTVQDTQKEFIWNGSAWQQFGDLSGLGALAYKNSASGSFTPSGTIGQPTFTGTAVRLVTSNISVPSSASFEGTAGNVSVTGTPSGTVSAPTISVKTAGSTTTVKNPTSTTCAKTVVAAYPGTTAPDHAFEYCAVSGENLKLYQLGYTTGASITTSNVTVKTGDAAYEADAPTFTGTSTTSTGSFTPAGTVSLTNTNKTATVSKASSGTTTFTPEGTVSQPSFTGAAGTVTVS